jgi:hypothetical protein
MKTGDFPMDITMTSARVETKEQRSGLSMLVVGALVGMAFMFTYLQVMLIKQLVMPLAIISGISLLLATLIAGRPFGGWRWTPLLGTGWSLMLLMNDRNIILYEIAHPGNTHQFAWLLVMLACVTTASVAGIGATIQHYRTSAAERRLPRWVLWGFTTMAGLLVGAVLVAAIPQTPSGVQISRAQLAQLPVVSLDAFNGGEIRIKAGELTGLRREHP